jgi:hypothetical protein
MAMTFRAKVLVSDLNKKKFSSREMYEQAMLAS